MTQMCMLVLLSGKVCTSQPSTWSVEFRPMDGHSMEYWSFDPRVVTVWSTGVLTQGWSQP